MCIIFKDIILCIIRALYAFYARNIQFCRSNIIFRKRISAVLKAIRFLYYILVERITDGPPPFVNSFCTCFCIMCNESLRKRFSYMALCTLLFHYERFFLKRFQVRSSVLVAPSLVPFLHSYGFYNVPLNCGCSFNLCIKSHVHSQVVKNHKNILFTFATKSFVRIISCRTRRCTQSV